MASITKATTGAGQVRWRARYRAPDGKSRERWFDRKVDAERHLTSVEHTKLTGAYVDPSAGRVTVEAYAEAWRAVQVHRPTTAAQVEGNLRRHVYPVLGDRPIAQVRPTEVQAWVRGLTDTLAPGTVELVYRYLMAIFRAAVEDQVISTNPCRKIRLPKQERRPVAIITAEQVAALAEGLPARYRALVILGAGTGLRQGEAFGLTADRVAFLKRLLTVDRQLVLVKGGTPVLAPPKTQASYRTIPLPDVVLQAITDHMRAFPVGPDGLLFTNDDGKPISRARFSDVWRPVAKWAGLEPGTGLHALRHFYASALIRHGESVKVVQARLGHASAAETLDTYSHLWPDSEDRTRKAVEAAFAAIDEAVTDRAGTSVTDGGVT